MLNILKALLPDLQLSVLNVVTELNYNKPDFYVIEFNIEDILSSSATVTTTTPPTTLPGTTGGVGVNDGKGDGQISYTDLFGND